MAGADLRENPYAIPPELVPRHRRDDPDALLDSRRVRGYLPVEVARPAEPELVPSADGLLSELLLTVPAYATGDLFWPVYEDLLATLPPDVRFVVLVHRSVADAVSARIEALGLTGRTTLLGAPDDVGFSIWAEDGYLFVHGAGGERWFVEPFVFRRRGDALVADLVTSGTDLRMYQAPLYFQGGNVLVGDDFFLIGGDYVNETIASGVLSIDPRATRDDQVAAVAEAYRTYLDHRRRVVVVASRVPVPVEASIPIEVEGKPWTDAAYTGNAPGTVQPLFHIDMFLTLAGRGPSGAYRIAVGDPSLAAEILGRPVWRYAMADVYDDIAEQLGEAGFQVVRTPLPLVAAADRAARVREWYFATSNNALVEIGADRRRVWLPSYGHTAWPELAAIDDAHVRIWRDLGFDATLLGDFHPFAQRFGAVHCIKKYLARRDG